MKLFTIACFFLISFTVSAQAPMGKAFILGQNEEGYEQLCQNHARTLLTVMDNDMEKAMGNWFVLLRKMESYAEEINFDLNGLKTYLHLFWNEDGTISNIGFFVQPESKNYKPEDLAAFFSSFARQYTPDADSAVKSDRKFSHYTQVSFPTFVQRRQ